MTTSEQVTQQIRELLVSISEPATKPMPLRTVACPRCNGATRAFDDPADCPDCAGERVIYL